MQSYAFIDPVFIDIFRFDDTCIENDSVFLTGYGTYFGEGLFNNLPVVVDIASEEIDIQCRACLQLLVGIKQCTTFQVKAIFILTLCETV